MKKFFLVLLTGVANLLVMILLHRAWATEEYIFVGLGLIIAACVVFINYTYPRERDFRYSFLVFTGLLTLLFFTVGPRAQSNPLTLLDSLTGNPPNPFGKAYCTTAFEVDYSGCPECVNLKNVASEESMIVLSLVEEDPRYDSEAIVQFTSQDAKVIYLVADVVRRLNPDYSWSVFIKLFDVNDMTKIVRNGRYATVIDRSPKKEYVLELRFFNGFFVSQTLNFPNGTVVVGHN